MIVIIQKDTQEPALRQLAVRLMNQGVRIGRTPGRDADVLTLVGDTWRLDPEGLAALPYVLDVRRITPPYRLASRAVHPENTVVEVGDARIGAEFCLIAGPCAVESQVQMAGVARRVKAAGAQLLRGGVFKPRTSPYSFQGLGQAGISMLTEAGREAGLPTITEITDPRQLEDLNQVDILQVGARNMQNFVLLQALGQVRKPVLLKRGMSATVTELLQAAEYILAGGNERVILCERGIRTFETDSRATLDIAAIPVLKKLTHLPVIVDPSHAAGRAELVTPLALAAVAAGADGLMVEVHDRPAEHRPCPATSLTGWPGRCGSCCPTPAADGGLLLPPAGPGKARGIRRHAGGYGGPGPGDPGAPAGRPGAVGHLSAAEAGHAAAVLRHRVSVSLDARGRPCGATAGVSVR